MRISIFFLCHVRLLKLGLRCVANVPDERPSIEDVLNALQAMRDPDAEDDDGYEVTLTIKIARQRINLRARSAWDLEELTFSKSTRGRSFTF